MRSSIGKCNCKALDALAGELRGCVRESDAQRIIGECNCRLRDALAGEFKGCVKESNAQRIIGECNCRVLDALAGGLRGRGQESNARHIIGGACLVTQYVAARSPAGQAPAAATIRVPAQVSSRHRQG